jgi:UDP-hydrolysing UDP-N-acetyl-D-glucosamine 2-epimerase
MRKICVVVGSRANYSSIKSVMRAVQQHPELQLQVVVAASALLDRYGSVVRLINEDGFKADARVNMIIEGETPTTMAKSTGLGLLELPTVFENLKPDVVLTVGDRFETMATAIAASYMNIALAHTMGGEVSGTIDESIRHAITKFAHLHFPACADARERIIRLGEREEDVYLVGCPRMDLVKEELERVLIPEDDAWLSNGVGGMVDLGSPFLLVSQHPVTTEYGAGRFQIEETLRAIQKTGMAAIVLWPNVDAGSEDIARGIRVFREFKDDTRMRFFKNLPVHVYIQLMKRTACLVGNSSSGIREGAFIGTPVVNIGTRQAGRQCGRNVIHVGHNADEIADAIMRQVDHGPYGHDPIYGDGNAGVKIADILSQCEWRIQKRITY